MRRFRAVVLLLVATLAATVAFVSPAAHATTITPTTINDVTLHPVPFHCLLDDPHSCGLQLPPDFDPHRSTGGGTHHLPPNNDAFCADERAALGPAADTELGHFHLEVIGCE